MAQKASGSPNETNEELTETNDGEGLETSADRQREIRKRIDPTNDDTNPETQAEFLAETYVDGRTEEKDYTKTTRENHVHHLAQFIDFLAENHDITDFDEVSGLHIMRYKADQLGRCARTTVYTRMVTLRSFFRKMGTHGEVPDDLADSVDEELPRPDDDEWQDDTHLSEDRAKEVLEELETFEYASRKHVCYLLVWHIGCRLGGVRAISLRDFHPENQTIEFHHRPAISCGLKNKSDGERQVNITEKVAEVVQDWIEHNRPSPDPDIGPEGTEYHPLIASRYGRVDKSTIRRDIYQATCCGDCTHDGKPLPKVQKAGECPESVGPHAMRRTSYTAQLNAGWPKKKLAERVNATTGVLDAHYDEQTKAEKAAQRREYVTDL